MSATAALHLQWFTFDVVTVDATGQGNDRYQGSADHFLEDLGNGLTLDMVRIPGGEFLMGSPDDEVGREYFEGPQHRVEVPEFFMGRYPVTQAQWLVVSGLEPVDRPLKSEPSKFKGTNRPVESVSWFDAVEFCARLNRLSGQSYSLPSEAEWEYACRAGTTTPFYFGEILSPDARYWTEYAYCESPPEEYCGQMTQVGKFPANAFGLHDLHGNVWEWCQDSWHESYNGSPIDGSVWVYEDDNDPHIIRGGSWVEDSWVCRSAYRNSHRPEQFMDLLGFRVALRAPKI